MSEYLKWYNSHCGHSKIKQQAKKEIEQLTEQLAKANERVRELEGVRDELRQFILCQIPELQGFDY